MNIEVIKTVVAAWGSEKPLVKRIFIFGSRARGDNLPDSDLDIAVELDTEMFQGVDSSGGMATWMFETKNWRDELQALLPYSIQLEQYLGEQTPVIACALQRSSCLVYEKGRATKIERSETL